MKCDESINKNKKKIDYYAEKLYNFHKRQLAVVSNF